MDLYINDYVKFKNKNIQGIIIKMNNNLISINANGKVLKVKIEDVEKMTPCEIQKSKEPPVKYKYTQDKGYTISLISKPETELMIRHQDSITAMQNVEKFLDTAYVNRITEVRIIHGKKGGILRAALHELLESHPHVSSFELGDYYSGQYGVTIVKLNIMN